MVRISKESRTSPRIGSASRRFGFLGAIVSTGFFLALIQGAFAQSTEEILEWQQEEFHASPQSASWWEWDAATGDWFGGRSGIENKGISFFGGYTFSFQKWTNLAGPTGSSAVYSGLLDFGVNVDLEALTGWKGASVQTTWLWIDGNTVTEGLNENFLISSDIAGFNTFRMLELWFQQEWLNGALSLRAGQFAADGEFIRSEYAALFLARSFGWPTTLSTNLPGGGPALPMGTLAVRLKVQPSEWFSLLFAGFQGNVFDQYINPHGFRWELNGQNGFFFLNEAQFHWHLPSSRFPGQFKTGMWMQTGQLADPLAMPTQSGNYGWYFLVDQKIYEEANSEENSPQGVGWFARVSFVPQDRTVAGFDFTSGLTGTGLIPTRDHDTMGLAFAYVQASSAAQRQPILKQSYGKGQPLGWEWTYQAFLTPWLIVQPDVQFLLSPDSSLSFDNAFAFGGSVSIRF